MGADYDDDIAKGINYQRCLKKKSKNSATTTHQKQKDKVVKIQATYFITYGNAFFTASIF